MIVLWFQAINDDDAHWQTYLLPFAITHNIKLLNLSPLDSCWSFHFLHSFIHSLSLCSLAFGIISTSKPWSGYMHRVLYPSDVHSLKCSFITLLSYDQVNWPVLRIEWIFLPLLLLLAFYFDYSVKTRFWINSQTACFTISKA